MKKPKLLGIEFVRVLSSYAVVLVHSGDETWGLPIDATAIKFRLFFYFGVPFFLAISFYFMTAKAEVVYSARFWKSKVERILIPYVAWSMIFFVLRVSIFALTNKTERLQQILQDPLSLVFLGGASYQLYFLPLLFTGILLVLLMPLLERFKLSTFGIFFCATLSIFTYNLLETSGNGFQLGDTNIAFQSLISNFKIDTEKQPLLRLILVESAWIIRCLPYFSIGLILNRLRLKEKLLNAKHTVTLGLAILAIGCNTLGKMFLSPGYSEIFLAITLLLFSMAISDYFTNNTVVSLINSIGTCSFGIYLIHPFVMDVLKPIIGKAMPMITDSISIFSMLTLSISCFLISWVIVAYLTRNKLTRKYLFGV